MTMLSKPLLVGLGTLAYRHIFSRASTITPVPYENGRQLQLHVCQSYCSDLPPLTRVPAMIRKRISMTISPVMVFTVQTPNGSTIHAALKLYDRRFGEGLRDVWGSHMPHTSIQELAFRAFIRQGMLIPFLGELEEEKKTELLASSAEQFFDDTTIEGRAKFEARLWQECEDHFRCETQAYEGLSDQGKSLPRMLAHVRLVAGEDNISIPPDLQDMASYLEVKGVLLELIDGYELGDITSPQPPSDPAQWQAITQSAADAAHEVNKRGVLMDDCAPRTVVVDGRSQTPYIIDFAECSFKDQPAEQWLQLGWLKDDGWHPDVVYWKQVQSIGNPAAIVLAIGMETERAMGVKRAIRRPDYDEIILDVERRTPGARQVP